MPESTTLALFGLLSCFTCFVGWRRGLFSLNQKKKWDSSSNLIYVALVFVIYFGVSNGITPIVGQLLQNYLLARPSSTTLLSIVSWLNFLNSGTIFLSLLIFFFLIPKAHRLSVWADPSETKHPYLQDISLAIFAWIISFPVVIFANQATDWALMKLLSIHQLPEQLAVQFLKMTFGHPLYIFLTVITITVFAPLVEETLFRGFLQSFIRNHLGSKQAIFITSVLFAFFHYSPEQKLANITIITSLFVFSLFLGLVYEKRKSLFAPMVLHATFNTVNVINLYFLGGIPGGPL